MHSPDSQTVLARQPTPDSCSSHTLSNHSETTGEYASRLAAGRDWHGNNGAVMAQQLGLLHDFGKATPFFQEYIRADGNSQTKTPQNAHSLLGALVTGSLFDTLYDDDQFTLLGFFTVAKHHGTLPNAQSYLGKLEDGDLWSDVEAQARAILDSPPLRDTCERLLTDAIDLSPEQIDASEFVETTLQGIVDGGVQRSIYGKLLDDGGVGIPLGTATTGGIEEWAYETLLDMWTTLTLADKLAASGTSIDRLTPEMADADRIAASVSPDDDSPLDQQREAARQAVIERVRSLNADDSLITGDIGSITLPTGGGKTLTGLQAALELASKKSGETPSRVVYALPYTSIIDQTAETLTDVFGEEGQTAADLSLSDLLTIHHHLSDTATRTDGEAADPNDDRLSDRDLLLGETWQAGMTLTTFVQLFESLTDPTNRQGLKLPQLRNSVIILDEPQTIPWDDWRLVNRLITLLTEQYDATVLFMTATQPRLFEAVNADHHPTELVPESIRDPFFEMLDRVTFSFDPSLPLKPDTTGESLTERDPEPKQYDEAAKEVQDTTRAGATLAICNTKESAEVLYSKTNSAQSAPSLNRLYDEMLPGTANDEDREPTWSATDTEALATTALEQMEQTGQSIGCLLTTNHRPTDRLRLINALKQILEARPDAPLYCVSTQLIEAGVDISFQTVFRDYAQLDSIVQAAGRCNRDSASDQTGRVHVWYLDHPADGTTTPSQSTYGGGGLRHTTTALTEISSRMDVGRLPGSIATMDEPTLTKHGVEAFFTAVANEGQGTLDYVEHIDYCRASSLGNWSIIKQQAYTNIEVVVVRTTREWETVGQMTVAAQNRDFDKLSHLRNRLVDRRLNVPIYDEDDVNDHWTMALPPIHKEVLGHGIRYLDAHGDSEYFNVESGAGAASDPVEQRFL